MDGTMVAGATQAAVLCLALNAYFEARGEGPLGMAAVSQVVINRVESGDRRWPREVCAAIAQGEKRRHRCQFSWKCDGKSDRPKAGKAWREARIVAEAMMVGVLRVRALEGATCYHAANMPAPPRWAKRVRPVGEIAGHVFYEC